MLLPPPNRFLILAADLSKGFPDMAASGRFITEHHQKVLMPQIEEFQHAG
jgi:hypothetical protein